MLGSCCTIFMRPVEISCQHNCHFCLSSGGEIDQNGVDSNLGEDSDSLGNSKTSKTSILPPTKEKRKPFFKKVSSMINLV